MNGKTIPALDVGTPPVCLDVELNLPDLRRGQGHIVPKPLPDKTFSLEAYLDVVMPTVPIEFLGRSQLLQLEYEPWMPTSLFFDTVHHCFQRHYPLALRPEVLMYLIVHEVATTINLYPNEYRHLFTASHKKIHIEVRHDGLVKGDANSPWYEALELFNVNLREHIPSDLAPSFLPPFSTATQETMAASTVAFMSAVRKFYEFSMTTLCGLPRIRLLGQPEDYTTLRMAAEKLSKPFAKRLGLYFANLLPVLKTMEEQAHGAAVDAEFWKSLYRYNSESGGDEVFNGWISTFVNYVQVGDKIEQKRPQLFQWSMDDDLIGIDIGSVPAQVSVAPFEWHYFDEEVLPMQFVGGVLGIDNVDGYATPALSYAVAYAA